MKEILDEIYQTTKRIKSGEILDERENERYLELTQEAMEFITNTDNDYAASCITERYIKAKKWSKIADEMGQLTDDSVRKCCARTIQRYTQ